MANGVNNNQSSSSIEFPTLGRARNRRDETISELAEGSIPQEAPSPAATIGSVVRNRAEKEQASCSIASWVTIDMNEHDKSLVDACISRIPAEEREEFFRQAQRLISPDIVGTQKCGVLVSLEKIHPADWKDFVRQLQSLISQDMDGHQKFYTIRAHERVARENREVFTLQALSLITADMSGRQKYNVILLLEKIQGNRDNFFLQTQRLIAPEMNGNQRFSVISTLSSIRIDNREEFVRQADNLITPDMSGDDKTQVVRSLATVGIVDWRYLVMQAQSLLQQVGNNENLSGEERGSIIQAIFEIPMDERLRRINRANERFRDEEMRGVLQPPTDFAARRIELLRTPLGSLFTRLPNDLELDGG